MKTKYWVARIVRNFYYFSASLVLTVAFGVIAAI